MDVGNVSYRMVLPRAMHNTCGDGMKSVQMRRADVMLPRAGRRVSAVSHVIPV
jgi:hypothetical protein